MKSQKCRTEHTWVLESDTGMWSAIPEETLDTATQFDSLRSDKAGVGETKIEMGTQDQVLLCRLMVQD